VAKPKDERERPSTKEIKAEGKRAGEKEGAAAHKKEGDGGLKKK
jgi:hypothetical protein